MTEPSPEFVSGYEDALNDVEAAFADVIAKLRRHPTETESRLWANPALMEEIERNIADPSRLVRRGRPQRQDDEEQ